MAEALQQPVPVVIGNTFRAGYDVRIVRSRKAENYITHLDLPYLLQILVVSNSHHMGKLEEQPRIYPHAVKAPYIF